ncbi:hypothetical protein ACWIUD_05475 [Helicobacter sp. 23-1044]
MVFAKSRNDEVGGDSAKFAESAGFWGFFVLDSANFVRFAESRVKFKIFAESSAESALFLRLDSANFAESALSSAARRSLSLSLSLSLVAFH